MELIIIAAVLIISMLTVDYPEKNKSDKNNDEIKDS